MTGRIFSDAKLEGALRRAFINHEAEFIRVDGEDMRSQFLRDSLALGVEKNWLCRAPEWDVEDEQYTSHAYVLTADGRKYFGLSGMAA